MIIKYIVIAFMAIVFLFGVWQFCSAFFGAGRTGNYLKIRKTNEADIEFGYRIVPTYRFVLRRLLIYAEVVLIFYLLTPLPIAVPVSLILMFSCEWWRSGGHSAKISMFSEWRAGGYKVYTLLLIILLGAGILVLLHFLLYPVLTGIIMSLF